MHLFRKLRYFVFRQRRLPGLESQLTGYCRFLVEHNLFVDIKLTWNQEIIWLRKATQLLRVAD